jgi:hypothetical protein
MQNHYPSRFLSLIEKLTKRQSFHTKVLDAALTLWRQLSAYLLSPTRSQRTPLSPIQPKESVLSNGTEISLLATELNAFLAPFVRDSGSEFQISRLEGLINKVAMFGYKLVSQPCKWTFLYDSTDRRKSSPDETLGLRGSNRMMRPAEVPIVTCVGLAKEVSDGMTVTEHIVVSPRVVRV